MRLSLDCGLSFRVWWVATFAIEIIFSCLVIALGAWEYITKIGNNAKLLYSPPPKTSYIVSNEQYAIIVTCWILLPLAILCVTRILSSILLVIGIKRSSPELSKFWIFFKVFAIMMSLFLVTASFTVSFFMKIATLISLMTDLLTSYFIRILYPELEKMRKFIVMVDPKPEEPPATEQYQKESDTKS